MIDRSFLLCWLFLILSSVIFYKSYRILDNILKKNYLKYNSYENNRKVYILTNILKSIFLFLISIAFIWNIIGGSIKLYDTSNWRVNIIFWKMLVAMYTSTDLVGLICNKRMATTTILHHYCVLIGFCVISFNKFKGEGIYKAIFIYGGFSSLTFLVNFYLGYKFLDNKDSISSKIIKSLSDKIYLFIIIINIIWQLYYIFKVLIYKYSIFLILLLLGLISSWLFDDLILLKLVSN